MSSFSINTNANALIALQNLSSTESQLTTTQNEISTGLKVASAKDDGATWAIAQTQRSQIAALDSVTSSLQRGQSTVDVAVTAGSQISDLLNQMKAKALSASDTSLDSSSRASLNADFTQLRDQIGKIVSNADFNGVNMIQSGGQNIYALANASGTSKLTVSAQDLSLGGSNMGSLGATSTISTVTAAAGMVSTLTSAIENVNNAVARLGTGSTALQNQLDFVGKLQDTLTTGVGNLVDANVAQESATLQALQTKQQLGVQALSIANSSSNVVLSLFR
jgi:flagellin